jgi:SAM-dependent methyltransferase
MKNTRINFKNGMLASDLYVPTLNQMGYMSPSLDEIQMAFIEHCEKNKSGLFLDIGCGFGVATLPVIEKGCRIIACDLEQGHLDVLLERVPEEKRALLMVRSGHFPNTLTFPDNSFDGINLSMVLHFLSPETIEKAFRNLFLCLKEGGRLFMTTSSPYQGVLSPFIPIYENKRAHKEEWPGYIPDIAEYVPQRAPLLPKRNIVFCIHELNRLALKFGFHIIASTFFSRIGMPDDLRLDGREYSGLICEKPVASSRVLLEKNKESPPIQAANII